MAWSHDAIVRQQRIDLGFRIIKKLEFAKQERIERYNR
jgi:hypothetical protein